METVQPAATAAAGDSTSREKARLESRRALELRKFFAPTEGDVRSEVGFNDTLNEDGALSAYAENLLWRMRGAHAMISLIDGQEQFFLGGALRNADNYDDYEELDCTDSSQWFGCSSVPTPGGLCENTLALELKIHEYPCFIVNDLSKDQRFASLPVVDGSIASYRFYAGTPITTDNGINIGSFFFFDDKPRAGLSHAQRKYLYSASRNVMKHLELKREAAERRRVSLMSKGIATFLERSSHEVFDGSIVSEDYAEKSHETSPANHSPLVPPELPSSQRMETPSLKAQESEKFMTQSKREEKTTVLDQIRSTLDHAAEILRDSLELEVGGVVFLDTTEGYTDTINADAYFDSETILGTQVEEIEPEKVDLKASQQTSNDHLTVRPTLDTKPEDDERYLSQGSVRSATDKYQAAKVQAISTGESDAWAPDTKVDGKTLQTFLNSYPKGNVWYIDQDGFFSSLADGQREAKQTRRRFNSGRRPTGPSDLTKKQAEAAVLSSVFHKARQIIFLPLWDAGGDRWYSGCFVWSRSAVPVFTVESEISYLSAFTNSVMVEISRLDAISANKIKSDFISSISHEFRSPLHGILASADFLRESQLDTSQLEFISTIQNCGGTLLDTINHVLDYSKINSFEMKGNQQGTISSELYAVTNMALLCEDIVNGMIAAKEFRATDEGMPLSSYSQPVNPQGEKNSEVVIILDIECREWNFKLQAGAIRRIIMNLFGNAQKYTKSGFILVDLRAKSPLQEEYNMTSMGTGKILSLHIRDSGRGMSTEYIERKLYRPFAQEDSFAPGVGLGLSIVWSIVNKLGGKIHVRSELGKGTDIEVTLPLEGTEDEDSGSMCALEPASEGEEAIKKLRTEFSNKIVVIFPGNDDKVSRATRHVWECIKKYCVDWFNFKLRSYTSKEDLKSADLVIMGTENEDCEAKRVLVVCKEVSFLTQHDRSSYSYPFARIFCPVGPFKLARCILALLSQDPSTLDLQPTRSVSTQTPLESADEAKRLDYNFVSINEGVQPNSQPPVPPAAETAKSDAIASRTEKQHDEQTLAGFKALTLEDVSPGFLPKLPSRLTSKMRNDVSQSIEAKVNAKAKPKGSSQPPPVGKPLNILAVDDNAINLQLLTRYLRKRKEDVISTATDGVEAVAAVRNSTSNPFDIIFMDISMPEMDGFEATKLIRSFERSLGRRPSCADSVGPPTPLPIITTSESVFFQRSGEEVSELTKKKAYIVALTGLGSRSARDQAEEYGFDDFLTKPVSFAKVGELLRRLSDEKNHN
ncbi:hypothetical protein BP5796_06318 [Coleophoma crateriformis]|uniref:Uncharacterized protein n=1 Tax=Coleophoma crateriformis TaxID=565419 RepID=A0A3D8RWV7_9HELO|nr:hypothetical protein BP5796_06318 [Coleophoma crateriformis]